MYRYIRVGKIRDMAERISMNNDFIHLFFTTEADQNANAFFS